MWIAEQTERCLMHQNFLRSYIYILGMLGPIRMSLRPPEFKAHRYGTTKQSQG
jgi:hypothetical protein